MEPSRPCSTLKPPPTGFPAAGFSPFAVTARLPFFVNFVLRSFVTGSNGGPRASFHPRLGDHGREGSPRTRPEMPVGFHKGENGQLDVLGQVRPCASQWFGDASGACLGCTWDASGMHRNRSHWVLSGAFCSLSRVWGICRIPWISLVLSGGSEIRTHERGKPVSGFQDRIPTTLNLLTHKDLGQSPDSCLPFVCPTPSESTVATPSTDPDLARVIKAWATLPDPIRRAVLALVGTAQGIYPGPKHVPHRPHLPPSPGDSSEPLLVSAVRAL